jgi:hypothetical protein
MAVKRYGPTLDAGVVIVEKEAEKSIEASLLGSTAYVGILDRGPVAELITTVGKKDMLAKTGGLIPDSLLPDANQDFWDHSEGAGVLFLYRVTDGTEVVSTLTLWDRSWPRNQVIRVDADNGGKWAGNRDTVVADLDAVPGDSTTETTVKLPDAYVVAEDKWKNGYIAFTETGLQYQITGNTEGDGVTGSVVTVTSDSEMLSDFGAGSDTEITLLNVSQDVWGQDKHLAVEVLDGQINPSTEFGLKVYINDELVKTYPDLSMDSNSTRYFLNMINDDPTNNYIAVTNLWVGAVTASNRPANFYAEIADTEIAAKQIDLATVLLESVFTGSGGPHTFGAFTYGASVIRDTYELEYTAAWALVSTDKQAEHTFPVPVSATPYAADNPYSFGFTVTESAPSSGDKFTINLLPLVEDEAIGGRLFFPDESFAPKQGWVITDNAEDTADITTGDLTNGGAISGTINVRLQYRQQLQDGYDGIAGIDENDYLDAFDVATSEFNKVVSAKGWGLIKFACPGVTEVLTSSITSLAAAQLVEKGGVAYAEAKNHQYRLEVQQTGSTDEIVVRDYVQTVMGKNDYEKVCFHGYVKVSDPVLTDRLKTVPTTGMIHGREAKIARAYNGYHKVAAGIDVKFPRIRELLTKDTVLNGEILNPAGLQRIEIKGGNFVLWGARIPSVDPAFKFTQHRELLTYYEQVLIGSFDWVVFAINDPIEQPGLIAALQSFFYPEWVKRAVRGDKFEDAVQIKIDEENNTDLTRAAGDLNADITLRLADTVERFVITIGKAGVFEATAPA